MERSEFQDLLVKEIEIAIMNILNDTEEDGMVAVGCTIGALFDKTIAIIEQPGETLQ
jgi:hypothetical protein